MALLILAWFSLRTIPKTTAGRIGFVVAVTAEEDSQRLQLQTDFIHELRRALDILPGHSPIQFIQLPSYRAAEIYDNDSARKYLRKCRAHFLVFGSARIRVIDAKEFHVLRLREIVAHKTIPAGVSAKFSKEMSDVFPAGFNLARENDLIGLEITSKWLAEASIYFIAVAALFSGDSRFAIAMLEALRKSNTLQQLRLSIPAVRRLRALIPHRLADAYAFASWREFQRWRESRQIAVLQSARDDIERAYSLRRKDAQLSYHLVRAIWHFVANRDIESAKRELLKLHRLSVPTWRYSLGFLEAYEGHMTEAMRLYDQAIHRQASDALFFELEEFLSWVIDQELDRTQLLYCRGFINLRAIGDTAIALRDFRKFLSVTPKGQHHNVRRRVERYVAGIERPDVQ